LDIDSKLYTGVLHNKKQKIKNPSGDFFQVQIVSVHYQGFNFVEVGMKCLTLISYCLFPSETAFWTRTKM